MYQTEAVFFKVFYRALQMVFYKVYVGYIVELYNNIR